MAWVCPTPQSLPAAVRSVALASRKKRKSEKAKKPEVQVTKTTQTTHTWELRPSSRRWAIAVGVRSWQFGPRKKHRPPRVACRPLRLVERGHAKQARDHHLGSRKLFKLSSAQARAPEPVCALAVLEADGSAGLWMIPSCDSMPSSPCLLSTRRIVLLRPQSSTVHLRTF